MIFTIWLIAVGIQSGIIVILVLQFFRYKTREPNTSISFSIIIAAHNEIKNLKKLVPALLELEYTNYEIIIALDRSSDDSSNYLKSLDSAILKFIEINEVPDGWDPKKYALTKAVEKSSNEWLLFTDADCLPKKKWLSNTSSRINEDAMIILGYSPYQSKGSFLHSFIQYEAFVTGFNYLSMALIGRPYMAVGRNLGIRKSFFEEKKGYDAFKEVTGGDDDLFIQSYADAKNTIASLGKDANVETLPKNDWTSYFNQKIRHLSVGSRYSFIDKSLHLLFNGSLLAVWTLIPLIYDQNILPIILFYLLLKGIGYRFAHSKMGSGFNYILLPLVDFIYAVFIPIIALRSKLVKDIRWKKN